MQIVVVWIALVLAGCAVTLPATAPEPPAAETQAPAPVLPSAPPTAPPPVAARLKVDSAAVQANARQFVAKPSTPVEAVATLEPLTRQVNRALAVMELHHRREGGYRKADVAAARTAADADARFLDEQAPRPPPVVLPNEEDNR